MILKFSFISRLLNLEQNLKENLKEKNVACTKSAQEILKDENLSEELAFIEANFCTLPYYHNKIGSKHVIIK